MFKFGYIYTAISLVLILIFGLIDWKGSIYFVLTFAMLLALVWGGIFIYRYFTSFKKELEEKFKIYRAEVINKNQMAGGYFDENLQQYKKEFSKKVLKDKLVQWCIILFCFACAGAFLAGMILA